MMRKKVTILLLVLIALIVTVQSCKKDKVTPQKEEGNEVLKMTQNSEMGETEANIVKFFRRINIVRENPNYEESKQWNYSKDSAIWYIEAALNYKYAYKWQYKGEEEHSDLYNIDSSFTNVTVNTSGDDYNIEQIQTSYDKLAKALEEQYMKTESDSKFFVLSDIILKNSNNNSLNIMQYSVIGKANQVIPQSGWEWGNGLGDCAGNNVGMDATDIIERKLSLYRATIQGSVYINIAHAQTQNNGEILPWNVPLPSGQSNPTVFFDNLIFNYSDQWGNPCLSNSDMNWYKDNILDIENIYRPSGKGIIFTDVRWDLSPSMPYSSIIHKLYPVYGEAHVFHYPDPID